MIDPALDRGVGQDTGGVLEGSGGKPAVGVERGADRTQDNVSGGGGAAALGDDGFVCQFVATATNDIAGEKLGITRFVDPDLVTHLADDGLEVFIMNTDALGFVNSLDFFDEVFLTGPKTLDLQ